MPQVVETILAGQHLTFSKCYRDMEQKEAGVGAKKKKGGTTMVMLWCGRMTRRPAINKELSQSSPAEKTENYSLKTENSQRKVATNPNSGSEFL